MGMNHQKIDIVTAYDAALLGRIAKVQGNARTVHNLVYSAVCVLLVVLGLQAGYETARGIILIAADASCFRFRIILSEERQEMRSKSLGERENWLDISLKTRRSLPALVSPGKKYNMIRFILSRKMTKGITCFMEGLVRSMFQDSH